MARMRERAVPEVSNTAIDQDAAEDQRDLGDIAPLRAATTEDLAGRGKPEQEHAAHHQGRGVEHDVARDVEIDRPTPVARRGDGDQRRRERGGAGPPLEQRLRHAVEQRGIGVQHEVVKDSPASATQSRLMCQRASGGVLK